MAQEKGSVNKNLQAFLPISLTNGATIDCLLDTGFDGALVLPRLFVEANLMPIVGDETFTAAEGNIFVADIALADVNWLGENFSIRVLISEIGDTLIGVEMLIDSVLEIDYQNLTVKITK